MFDILWICLTYCIGSVPFGLVFAKTFCRIDPRTAGSGNVGATNVARLCGKAWGAATLACDLLKGTIPVFIAMQYSTSELVWTLTALAAILGHLYSCFLGFKGGKAVATSHRCSYPSGVLAAPHRRLHLPVPDLGVPASFRLVRWLS